MLLWFYGFLVSKIYQISISCFLIEIDFITMNFKILLDGSSSCFGARLFENRQTNGFPEMLDLQKEYKVFIFSYIFWSILAYLIKSINKGSSGLKNPEIMEFGGFGPSHNKTEILLNQNWSK